jgi:drug/metabolite transporter (DMT)-like permease
VVATVGLFLLTGADLGLGKGEIWTLACALAFAIWIVYQGAYVNRLHPVPFMTVQMAVLVVLCLPATAEQGLGEMTSLVWFAVLFTGIACSAIALSLQLWGQKRIAPSRAALILLSEPVFAGIAGYVDGERLGAIELVGATVILAGIVIAEFAPGRARAEAEDAEVEAELEARLR